MTSYNYTQDPLRGACGYYQQILSYYAIPVLSLEKESSSLDEQENQNSKEKDMLSNLFEREKKFSTCHFVVGVTSLAIKAFL